MKLNRFSIHCSELDNVCNFFLINMACFLQVWSFIFLTLSNSMQSWMFWISFWDSESKKLKLILCVDSEQSFLSLFVKVDEELEIKAYYAGHVLGAAMFHIKVGQQSVVYTVSRKIAIKVFCYIAWYVVQWRHIYFN